MLKITARKNGVVVRFIYRVLTLHIGKQQLKISSNLTSTF